jgi:tRNA/rRNA methyltransferase
MTARYCRGLALDGGPAAVGRKSRKCKNQPVTVSDGFAFVLVRPKSPGNIGAAARALKNMGMGELRLVAPAAGNARIATAMAVHGRDVLDNARRYPDLASAIEDCTLTVGSTCRTGLYRSAAKPVREAAGELVSASAANRVALIFGPEDFGLTNRELQLCQRLVTIPTAPDYPSLNLAQAIVVVAYELFMAGSGERRNIAPPPEFAPAAAVDAMFDRMAQALVAIGFLAADNPEHIMFALRGLLGRSGMTARELDILNGIAAQIRWFGEGGFETIEAKRRAGKRLR